MARISIKVEAKGASWVAQRVKNPPASAGDSGSTLGREDPLEKEWQTTPVFLPGKFHGQRSLAGHSPWGSKESDTTEQLTHIKVASREQLSWEEHGLLIREPGAPGSQECVGYS